MLGRVKDILGIEGVKIELVLPKSIKATDNELEGTLRLTSMRSQRVIAIKVVFIERYTRGRGEEKVSDEYLLGEIDIEQVIDIPVEQIVEVDFVLPFTIVKSDMEEMGSRNFLYRGLVSLAKQAHAVSSEYRIEAYAKVKGTTLNPFVKSKVNID